MSAFSLQLGPAMTLPDFDRWRLAQRDAVEWLGELPDGSVDCIVTDIAYESLEKHRAKGTTTRLKKSAASSNEWFDIFPNRRLPDLFAALYRVLKRDRHFYFFCDDETMFVAKPLAEAAGFKFWKAIVWDYGRIGMGYHYRARHQKILFFEKGKRRLSDLSMADVLNVPRVSGRGCDCQRSEVCEESAGQESSTRRDTSSSTPELGSSSLSTFSSGNDTTDPSLPECRSTTRTKSRRTTGSTTSSSSTHSRTSAFTQGVSSETECGGSRAPSAESSSQSTETTGTSRRTDGPPSSGGAKSVISGPSLNENSASVCNDCGKMRAPYPTEKPVELLTRLVTQSSVEDEIVIDPFMGSGSAGVAALRTGRRFLGNDISHQATALARTRLEALSK